MPITDVSGLTNATVCQAEVMRITDVPGFLISLEYELEVNSPQKNLPVDRIVSHGILGIVLDD